MRRLTLLALVIPSAVADWPQFLGPSRNGVSADSEPAGQPRIVWKAKVGQGFSGPVVAEGKVIVFHRLGNNETVECLDAATGKRTWVYEYPTAYRDDFGFDEGPRGTPAIAGGRVYTSGAEGLVHALDFATGKKIWSVDTHKQFQVAKGFFGAAASPLVEDGRLLLTIGGTAGVAALDAATGKVLWTATKDEAGYAAPVAATIGGERHALFFTRAGLVDVDPATGRVRFQFRWRSRSNASVNAASPVVSGNRVLLTASYGTGATLLEVTGDKVKQVWSSDDALSCHYSTPVLLDGVLYGFHGRQEEGQNLRAVAFDTGKVLWDTPRFGAGTVALAGTKLVLLKETGELVIAPASRKAFQPSTTLRILTGTVRAYPALDGGRLYARNEDAFVAVALR